MKHRARRVRMPVSPFMKIPRAAFVLRSFAFVVLVVASAAIFFLMPPVPTIAVIQAITEFVSYDVVVPDLAQLRLAGYALTYEAPAESSLLMKSASSPTAKKPLCLTGLLTPNVGAHVSYKRLETGPIVVVIERKDDKPAATFALTSGDAPPGLQKAAWIRLETPTSDDDKAACPGKASVRLPIYGPTRIGTPLRPESAGDESSSGVLIEGTVDLYAKTVELSHLREGANKIYPTSVTQMDIPPGAELSEYVEPGASPTPWAGFIKPDTDLALDVRITTPASRIQILRPGIGIKPETLATSLFAQLTNDPVVLSLQVAAVFLFSILQAASSWVVAREAQVVAEQGAPGSPLPPQTPDKREPAGTEPPAARTVREETSEKTEAGG
ncbi:MAG: hypothetical protein KGM42_11330 [Hyphomicrobiales bacterium]|nr:hypothetical protein [Hyphomicrobiales bacterium]